MHIRLSPAGMLAAVTVAGAAAVAQGGSHFFEFVTLKNADGSTVDGGSSSALYPKSLAAKDFSLAVTYPNQTTTNGVVSLGSAQFAPLTILTANNAASTTIANAVFAGTAFKSLTIDLVTLGSNASGSTASWTFINPYFTSFTHNSASEQPTETYVLGSFGEAIYTFTSYTAAGAVRGTQTTDWKFLPGGTNPVTSITGSVPDYRLITTDDNLPVADGIVGPTTTVVPVAAVALSASDAPGASSFSTALHWANNKAPANTVANRVDPGLTLRTPASGGNVTFNGLALTIGDGGALGDGVLSLDNATGAVITVPTLVLNSGTVVNSGGTGGAATSLTLAGNSLNINSGGGTLDTGAPNRTMTVSSVVSGNGRLTITGGGHVVLTASNSFTGVTAVDHGTLQVTNLPAINVLTNAGGVELGDAGGRIEIGHTASSTVVADVRAILAAGYHQDHPFAEGQIRAPGLTGRHVLGYRNVGMVLTVAVALSGDADLDGGVSINDFNALAANFGRSTNKDWADGDFDYDGGVSINDFNLLAANFGSTDGNMASLLAFAAAHHDLAAFEAATGMPEPAALGVLAFGTVLGLRRRR